MRIKIVAFLIRKFLPKGQSMENLLPVLHAVDKALERGYDLAVTSQNPDYDEMADEYQYTTPEPEQTERVLN